MVIKELILKVASICNLNCRYCYVFNQGDYSYRKEPNLMSVDIMTHAIERIAQHCNLHKLKDFIVIFHGGEPLLAHKSFCINFVKLINESLEDVNVQFALQTNGTLLTQEWLSFFNDLNISIGISLDGTLKASKYRVYKATGNNAYNEIIRSLNLLYVNQYPINILSVINTGETPNNIYEHLKQNHVFTADFLFPDITYDVKNQANNLISDWLINLFDLWYNDISSDKPRIRLFDIIIGLILGVERGNEVMGQKFNQCLCIKTDGSIQAVDNLMVCGDGFTKSEYNVSNNTFDDALENKLIKIYYSAHQDDVLCSKCQTCIIKYICGGGQIAHRYSSVNGFDNPSVYCNDISALVSYIQNKLVDDLFEVFDNKLNIEKLTTKDFK